jgi:hypothetical protein
MYINEVSQEMGGISKNPGTRSGLPNKVFSEPRWQFVGRFMPETTAIIRPLANQERWERLSLGYCWGPLATMPRSSLNLIHHYPRSMVALDVWQYLPVPIPWQLCVVIPFPLAYPIPQVI